MLVPLIYSSASGGFKFTPTLRAYKGLGGRRLQSFVGGTVWTVTLVSSKGI